MPDDPTPTNPVPPATTANPPQIPVEALATALADAWRWRILWEIGRGEPLPVGELARRLGRSPSVTSKHVGVLRKAGLIVAGLGGLYRLAPAWCPTPGSQTADLGCCLLRLDRPL